MKKLISFLLSIVLILSSLAFTAVNAADGAASVVYVSADGAISGVTEKVYTDVASALSALGSSGGTVYVEGTVVLPVTPNISALSGKTINICGYGNKTDGNIVEFKCATKSFLPSMASHWVFDYVTVKMQDGNSTENWIYPNGGSITFGENCAYMHGYRESKNLNLRLHIGSYYGTKGATVNFNSPVAQYVELGSVAGYIGGSSSSFTTSGDVVYNLNAGIVENVYGGMRNGTTGFATLNGDVYYNFNGANLPTGSKFAVGNVKNGVVNGNIFFTFNGGEITRDLLLGSTSTPEAGKFSLGNAIITFNGKSLSADGKTTKITIKSGSSLSSAIGERFLIINNSDLLTTDTVTLSGVSFDYYITTVGGSAQAKFAKSENGNVGTFLGFDIKADTEGYVPAIGENVLQKNSNGYYDIEKSTASQNITFVPYEDVLYGNTVYVSADGVIEGVDKTVYTSVANAVSALGKDGGTVFIEGTVLFPSKLNTSTVTDGSISFIGYRNTPDGNIAEFANNVTCFEPTTSVDITFENITLKREDGKTNECWIASNGGTLKFGSGCLYVDGVRTTNSTALKLHIGAYKTANGSKIVFDAPTAEYAEVGTMAGYFTSSSSLFTTNGDFVYDFNSGIFKNVYGGLRNGTDGYSTLNGDVYYNFNGGKFTSGNIYTGNYKNGIINGNIIFTFNGGNITKPVYFGGANTPALDCTKYGNTAVIINADKITASGETFNLTVNDGRMVTSHKSFLVINHAEKLENNTKATVTVKAIFLDYYISVKGGSITPKFEKSQNGKVGAFLGFEAVPDNEGEVPARNGRMLKKNDAGLYIIAESGAPCKITFAKRSELASFITLKKAEGDTSDDIVEEIANGEEFIFPEYTFTPDSTKIFSHWVSDNGEEYYHGDKYIVTGNMTFNPVFITASEASYFYVSADGSDSNNGLSSAKPLRTIEKAYDKANGDITVHIIGEAQYPDKSYANTVTFKNGTITNDILTLCGNTVFDTVTLNAKEIVADGFDIKFTENVNVNDAQLKVGGENVNIALCGGDFDKVSLLNAQNILISVGETSVGELVLGTESGKTAKNIAVSNKDGNIKKFSFGEVSASGRVVLITNDKFNYLHENYFENAQVTTIENNPSADFFLNSDGTITLSEGEHIYIANENVYHYAVNGKITPSAGIYNVYKALGDGKNYVHYPKKNGLYFKEFTDDANGRLDAVYTAEKYIAPYYVSENGNDENSGTSAETPLKTVARAIEISGSENDTRIIVMNTIYWNENANECNIPDHKGELILEGLSADNVASQIIDFSRQSDTNAGAGAVRVNNNTTFKNISFKVHHYKQLYTNGFTVTFEGEIGYIKGTSGGNALLVTVGKYNAESENDSLIINAKCDIDKIQIGHRNASSITDKATLYVNGANIGTVYLCGEGSHLNDVDIVLVDGSISSFKTNSSYTTGTVSGDVRVINGGGKKITLANEANVALGGKLMYLDCAEGIKLEPTADEKIYKLLTDVTAKAINKETAQEYVSAKGAYIGLPEGSYDITLNDKNLYTNDGSKITVLSETSLNFDEYLYRKAYDDAIFTGWCYEGKKTGPASGDILPAGTVLKAVYKNYELSEEEFGVFGVQIRKADKGLRYIVDKKKSFSDKFSIVESGALILPTKYLDGRELVLGGTYTYGEKTYDAKYVTAEKLFSSTDELEQYTLCLTKTSVENYGRSYTVRAYVKCKTANGNDYMIYSAPVNSSLVKIARTNKPAPEDEALFEEIVSAWENTYFGGGTTPVTNVYANAYRVNDTGVVVRKIELDSGNDIGTPVKIAMITDSHLGKEGHDKALINAMECAQYSDQIVLCGDNVEAASNSTHMKLLNDIVFKPYPEAIVAMGNHEYFYPGNGTFDDVKKKVDALWPHNPDYYSRVINGKVLVITIDNSRQPEFGVSQYGFSDEKAALVKADIKLARRKGYAILLFCHTPLASLDTTVGSTKETLKLISENADIIKAIFSGHSHVDKVYSYAGSYKDADGKTVSKAIPYYNLEACPEDDFLGNVLFINVK